MSNSDFFKKKVKIGNIYIEMLSLIFYVILVMGLIVFTLFILLRPNKLVLNNSNNGLDSTITIKDNKIILETNYDSNSLKSEGIVSIEGNTYNSIIDGENITITPTDNPSEYKVDIQGISTIFIKED